MPPTFLTSMSNVMRSKLRITPDEAVFVTVRSTNRGVGVAVNSGVNVIVGVDVLVAVAVAVAVAVLVCVEVAVGVSVGVDVNVAVGVIVGVSVIVAVGVMVGVLIDVAVPVGVIVGVLVDGGVSVTVGVLVAVRVGVAVTVGVGVIPTTVVSTVTELFASFCSTTMLAGSIVAVLLVRRSTFVVMRPVIVIVATALAPVPKAPKSQSSVPPVTPPMSEQMPRVVVNPVYWKLTAGSLITRTDAAGAEPMFLAWIV